ncbi:MAG: class I SAM-dependent methyltransferase [Myxococcales bacterium]|nr:MAG: class I SAM-dependent methyltransferase [Myxococcales bacterium]
MEGGAMTLVACIDCGAEARAAFARVPKDANYVSAAPPDAPHPGDSGYLIMRCPACDSCFLHPDYFAESQAVYSTERYYRGYFPDNIHTGGGPAPYGGTSALRRRLYTAKARALLDAAGLAPVDLRALEIGCGAGDLVDGMSRLGVEVIGVDVSADTLGARERGLDIRQGRVEEMDQPAGGFGLIYTVQVFEHIPDLGPTLAAAHRLLAEDGRLVVVVPNDLEGYRARRFHRIWWMIPPLHVRYFTARSLETVFARHGFRLETLKTEGQIGDDVSALVRWRLKHAGLDGVARSRAFRLAEQAATHALLKPVDYALSAAGRHANYLAVFRRAAGGL